MSVLPFSNSNDNELASAIFGDGQYLCKICSLDCLDSMECVQCDVCDLWFHTNCIFEDPDAHRVIVDNDYDIVCSDRCYMQLLPFCKFTYNALVKSDIFELKLTNKNTCRATV